MTLLANLFKEMKALGWNPNVEEAFLALKTAMIVGPILALLDFKE